MSNDKTNTTNPVPNSANSSSTPELLERELWHPFSVWIDSELELMMVAKSEWETTHSNRKYFGR